MSPIQRLYHQFSKKGISFPSNLLLDQKCPFHPGTAPSLKVFPEVMLFRCHECANTYSGPELLLSLGLSFEETATLAIQLNLSKKSIPDLTADMVWRENFNTLMRDGRKVYKAFSQSQNITRRFGDIGVFTDIDMPTIIPNPERQIGPATQFTARTLRNLYGRVVGVEVEWNERSNRTVKFFQPRTERLFYMPRWTDFLPLTHAVVCSNEDLALNIQKGMDSWEREYPIISLTKGLQPIRADFPPFEKIWFSGSSEKEVSDAFAMTLGNQVDVHVNFVNSPEIVPSSFSKIAGPHIPKVFQYLHRKLQNSSTHDACRTIAPCLENPSIDPVVSQEIIALAAKESNSSVSEILSLTSRFFPSTGATIGLSKFYCRNRVYIRKVKNLKARIVSNFCVRIVDRKISRRRIVWVLVLMVGKKSTVMEVPDRIFQKSSLLWKEICLKADSEKLDPPFFNPQKLKEKLPQLIKMLHNL